MSSSESVGQHRARRAACSCQIGQRPCARGVAMQECKCLPDLGIARAGQPASALRRQLIHVPAERFHEQSLGELGKNRQPTGAAAIPARSRNGVSRSRSMRQPGLLRTFDLEYRWQAAQEQAFGVTLATQVAADDPGHGSFAAPFLGGQLALRELRQQARPGKQLGSSSVPHLVSVTVRKDDDVARPRELTSS